MPLNKDQLRTAILDVLVSLANAKEPADQQQRLATGLADAIDSYVKAAEVRDVKVAGANCTQLVAHDGVKVSVKDVERRYGG